MHSTDIARTRRQVERVAEAAQEVVDDAETVDDAGFDASQSERILEQQQALVQELGQALADFNALVSRAETVERTIEYEPGSDAFEVTHDAETSEVTITYRGSAELPAGDVAVTVAGSETDPWPSETLTTDTAATVDVSGLADGDRVVVSWTGSRVRPEQITIKPWDSITGSASAPEIDAAGLTLPEHNLTEATSTFERGVTIGAQPL